jgi:hypothetical protein
MTEIKSKKSKKPLSYFQDSDSFDDDDLSSNDDVTSDDDDVIVESCKEIITVNELANKVREHHLVEAIRLCSLW